MNSILFRFLLCFLLFQASPAFSTEKVPRTILALYSSRHYSVPKATPIHQNIEMVLNHLGCVVSYWDVEKGMPPASEMQDVRGVVTWFEHNTFSTRKDYLKWATTQLQSGIKFAIFGALGGFLNEQDGLEGETADLASRFYRELQMVPDENIWLTPGAEVELISSQPEMVEFERSLAFDVAYFSKVTPLGDDVESYLVLALKNRPDSKSSVVLKTPRAGFVQEEYAIYYEPDGDRRQWRLNPFRFLKAVFELENMPAPDITTRLGSRMWFSHIDGDAIISKSEIAPDKYCGEIILDEVLKANRYPVSVSIVVAELLGNKRVMDIARSIFAVDWVEPASHSFSHPFYWDINYKNRSQYKMQHLPVKGYKYDAAHEVTGSVAFINEKLLPPARKVKTMFWTGNCEATIEALQACADGGLLNVNGGDSRFDAKYPSITSIAPLSVPVGKYRQFYASNANENIYTNDWLGPFFGFQNVTETFDRTESPRRLRPIDVYYHFYSGEKWAALNSLKKVLDQTTASDVAPVYISEYLHGVQGFLTTKIEKIEAGTWRITENNSCRTIRFDDEKKVPDLSKSRNVQGYLHYQNSLYVHLGAAPESIISLGETQKQGKYVHQASHLIDDLDIGKRKIAFSARGYGKAFFIFAGMAPGKRFQVDIDGKPRTFTSTKSGQLRINAFIEKENRFEIRL